MDDGTSEKCKKRRSLRDKKARNLKRWTEDDQKALDDLDEWFHERTVKAVRKDARKGIKQNLLGPVQ
jgi:hypothetical protein